MPMDMYDMTLEMYELPPLGEPKEDVKVTRLSKSDLPDTESCPVKTMASGTSLEGMLEGCLLCSKCVHRCPEKAISVEPCGDRVKAIVKADMCAGTACRHCEKACPGKILHLDSFQVYL